MRVSASPTRSEPHSPLASARATRREPRSPLASALALIAQFAGRTMVSATIALVLAVGYSSQEPLSGMFLIDCRV